MQTLNPGDSATLQRIVSELRSRPALLLEVLQAGRAALGCVPGER